MLDNDYINSLPYINPIVDRRTVVILGGCSGIGWYTVLHLYLHGYIIYITGRSKTRVSKCIDELKQQSIYVRLNYTSHQVSHERFVGELLYLELDPGNLKSVISASKTFAKLEDNLNIFINNLSTSYLPHTKTVDGFEIQLQLNYITPFLLITQLLPLLENTNNLCEDPPKIIYSSTPTHHLQFRYFDMENDFNYRPDLVYNWLRYSKAKVSGIHMIKMLSLRNPRILSMAIDTGFVMNANIFSHWTRLPIIGVIFWCFFQVFGFFVGSTIEEGSFAIIKGCLDPNLSLESDNGKFFNSNGNEARPSRVAGDMDYAARTWIWTVNKLGQRSISIP